MSEPQILETENLNLKIKAKSGEFGIKSQSSKSIQTSQSEPEKQGKSGLSECYALKSRADKSENSSLGVVEMVDG